MLDDQSLGPIRLSSSAHAALRPAGIARIDGGFWSERQRINAAAMIPGGFAQLEQAGNLENLRLAAGTASGPYHGDLPFLDTDVYKWLEAASWQLARENDPLLTKRVVEAIELLSAAQEPDGYLESYFQVTRPGEQFVDLKWGHELYCAGHLIQAAVAHSRATGRPELLQIARRVADHLVATFGVDRKDALDGHPGVETALVELYRETADERYLRLAEYFIDRRGHGLVGDGKFGREYWQDHTPLREAQFATGHSVRQLYLLTGAIDVYLENGDETLLTAVVRLWEDMVATKTYITGGMGSHHTDESFGEPYELPNDRAYCETCAAIASVMLNWRLLLATGDTRYADLAERTLYNGFLSGISLDGTGYLYINPLQVRDGHGGRPGDHGVIRAPWFRCACCPPNVMRLLATLQHYVAATDGFGLRIHQYASGEFGGMVAGGSAAVRVSTEYPWHGRIEVAVTATPGNSWPLSLRVPDWSGAPTLQVNGESQPADVRAGWVHIDRSWRVGDRVVLDVDMPVRPSTPHPRVDAARGCVAIERGPLLYCLEQTDQPAGIRLDDVAIDPAAALSTEDRPDLLGGVTTIRTTGVLAEPADQGWWPYGTARSDTRPVELTAVPYYAWANRARGSMRVWIPLAGT